jgi:hypothetical protein
LVLTLAVLSWKKVSKCTCVLSMPPIVTLFSVGFYLASVLHKCDVRLGAK